MSNWHYYAFLAVAIYFIWCVFIRTTEVFGELALVNEFMEYEEKKKSQLDRVVERLISRGKGHLASQFIAAHKRGMELGQFRSYVCELQGRLIERHPEVAEKIAAKYGVGTAIKV